MVSRQPGMADGTPKFDTGIMNFLRLFSTTMGRGDDRSHALKKLMPTPAPRARSSIHLLLLCGIFCAVPVASAPAAPQEPMSSMPGMSKSDMADMPDMKSMGPSMAAMAGHMAITPLRPKQPGDEAKAEAIVAQVRAAIERYKDYKKALADGYVIANPEVNEPQFHFNNASNIKEAEQHFDPTKPSSLLYFQTPKQRYKLEGVMFTAAPTATLEELNERIPLSIVRWHEHTNFCAAPADKVKEYLGQHPKFGNFGSIKTAEACKAEGGTFLPVFFTWMIHVFPFEDNVKDQFSMNDDIPHFGLEP